MKSLKQMKIAFSMSLVPMLFTIGCGLPPAEMDSMGTSTKKMMETSYQAGLRQQPVLKKLQGPEGTLKPVQKLSAVDDPTVYRKASKLAEQLKEQCGVLMPTNPKQLAGTSLSGLTPEQLQARLKLEWDVMPNQPAMPIYIYINMFDKNVKLLTDKVEGLDGIDTLQPGQLKLTFRGHLEPGNYTKVLFFQYKDALYKLPLCYNVN